MRYNWNTPLHLSPNEKGTLYIGSQYLFRTRDHGATWDRISPDLTTNNPLKQKQEESGGITVDNSAAEMHTTIYSISESPRAAGQIWVGTDDGNVQLTRNGGGNWTDVTKALKLPVDSWISWVEASRYDAGTAYVTVDRHTAGDFTPRLYRTRDYGRSWTPLITPASGVEGYAHVIREDRQRADILYLGTELGLFASVDGGAHWARFRPNNFPAVAVRDIALPNGEDDLVLATHGRGIWVIDDVSPLRSLNAATLASQATLIGSAPQQMRIETGGGWAEGDTVYFGENPPGGAVITYFQKQRHVIGRMKLEILDAAGNVVDTLPAKKSKGLNRITWSMRTKPPLVPPAASLAGASTVGQRIMPGNYSVRLTKAGQVTTTPLVLTIDKRSTFTMADRKAQFDAVERVKGLFARMSKLNAQINAVRAQSSALAAKADAPAATREQAKAVAAKADALRLLLVATKEGGAITGEERLREHMDTAYGAVNGTEGRPTPYALAYVDALEKELAEVEASYAALVANDVSKLSASLETHGLKRIDLAAWSVDEDGARGGRIEALASGLLGLRFTGNIDALTETGEKD